LSLCCEINYSLEEIIDSQVEKEEKYKT